MRHILNAVKDAFDPSDRTVAPNAPGSSVKVSFRHQVPYIKDQGKAGSCTAHAGTEMLELLYRMHPTVPVTAGVQFLRFSPLFQYAQERIAADDFTSDSGADIRTIFRVLAKTGCCLEQDDPYSDARIFALPTTAQVKEAGAYRIGAYHRILDVATAKTVLQSGYSFVVGMPLFEQFEYDEAASMGLIAMPQGSSIGGHAMHVIGCDDSKQVLGQTGAFEVQNSWGPEWGDAGYCWIPYSYFAAVEGEWDFWMAHFGRPWMVKQ